MLDSNTDRSYFMIGAVIIGAVLIAGALFVFRDTLFTPDTGLIPKLIDGVFDSANKAVGDIAP